MNSQLSRSENLLMIFTKAPALGKVKTRLISELGAEKARAIHVNLVMYTLARMVSNEWSTQLWCSPDCHSDFFKQMQRHFNVVLKPQMGEDLGQRMYQAFRDALRQYKRVIVIGTDCPVLEASDIRQSFAKIRTNTAVVIPATDGGYVLLGLNRVDRGLFFNIQWGTGQVMEVTRAHFIRLGWPCFEYPSLWDVDWPEDYRRARQYLLLE